MPVSKYYKGHGQKKGKEVFYATANKKGMKPKGEK